MREKVKKVVLLVEGDRDLRDKGAAALIQAGFGVQPVGSLAEIPRGDDVPRWDLVVVDMDAAAFEAGQWLDDWAEETTGPLLVIESGTYAPLTGEERQDGRLQTWLRRPYTPEMLVRRVAELFERARVRAEVAVHDEVTGALTAQAVEQALHDEVIRAERSHHPIAVALVEVDGFAELVERHGRRTADRVQAELCWLFRARMRRTDRIGRIGPGRFLCILPEARIEGALRAVDSRRLEFSEVYFDGRSEPFVATLSAGLASYPDDAEEPLALVDAAAAALERAQADRGDRVEVFHMLS